MPPATGMPLSMCRWTWGRAGGEVAAVGGHGGGVGPGDGDREPVGGGDRHLVVEPDGEEDGGQAVEAVGAAAADGQLDVDLGRDPDGDR
jgi:hypothetical protein